MLYLPRREGEVDKRHFSGNLWCVVRIGKLRRDVKLEVIVVGNDRVSQLYHSAASLFECLLQ